MAEEITTVGVVGGGPVGLLLAYRLHQADIPVIVLDRGDGAVVEDHGRAGLWTHQTVNTLRDVGLATELLAHGRRHPAFELRCFGESRQVPYGEWAGGVAHYAYPQHLLERDIRTRFTAAGGLLRAGVTVTAITGLDTDHAVIHYDSGDAVARRLRCDVVVGADGAHGMSRDAAPPGAFTRHRGAHSSSALAIFAETASPEAGVVYATGEHGFAGHAIRTDTISRLYVQCAPEDTVDDWPLERIWAALDTRLALTGGGYPPVPHGRILSTAVVAMRTQIIEPLRYRSLFLAGDAGHTITPMGAKGANLGIADAADLAESLIARYHHSDSGPLRGYSQRRLTDAWQDQAFSWQLLDLLCPPTEEDTVARHVRRARLEEILAGGPLTSWFGNRYAGTAPRVRA